MGSRSRELFEAAQRSIPGGVNSPVRAFGAVGGDPVFMRAGTGARLHDVDGRDYVDFVLSWGPLVLGHRHPRVVAALRDQLELGTSFGTCTEVEVRLAEAVRSFVPSMERTRLVSSGTEATMSALRLARAATGRTGVVKVDGCYHGHVDALLVQAGSGVATLGIPGSPGVPEAWVRTTHVVPFNDADALATTLADHGDDVAAVILEPVPGNMGCVPPQPGYLERVRELASTAGAVLIFDEVMSGFRVGPGGAQERFGVRPDLTCLGKVIGGGLPVGAYGGRAELMDQLAPSGPVYQAGTLSGNPLAVAAGLATLDVLREEPEIWDRLETTVARLAEGIRTAAAAAGRDVQVQGVGSMFTVFFHDRPVRSFADAKRCDTEDYGAFFRALLEGGVYFPPSQFEAAFVSAAHGDAEVDSTLDACRAALAAR